MTTTICAANPIVGHYKLPPASRPKPANLIQQVHEWAKSPAGQDWSFGLATASLLAPAVGAFLGAIFGGEVGAGIGQTIGDGVGWLLGAASTTIDCFAEITSPACVLGVASVILGPLGTDAMSTAKHVKHIPKLAGFVGAGADATTWATGFDEWLHRRNFGNG